MSATQMPATQMPATQMPATRMWQAMPSFPARGLSRLLARWRS